MLSTASQNSEFTTYLRPTDGSPSVNLGTGQALAFSSDEKSVLIKGDDVLSVLPVGVGTPRKVPILGLTVDSARCLRDGKRLVVTGQRKEDTEWRLFVLPLEGGALTPLSAAPVTPYFLEVSRDDRFVAAISLDGTLTLFPLDKSPSVPLSDLGRWAVPAGWTSDGHLWASQNMGFRDTPSRLLRYDIPSRQVVEERALTPADLNGLAIISRIHITPDSRAIAVEYIRRMSNLYLLKGLSAPRH